jgi:hypothetical protein
VWSLPHTNHLHTTYSHTEHSRLERCSHSLYHSVMFPQGRLVDSVLSKIWPMVTFFLQKRANGREAARPESGQSLLRIYTSPRRVLGPFPSGHLRSNADDGSVVDRASGSRAREGSKICPWFMIQRSEVVDDKTKRPLS